VVLFERSPLTILAALSLAASAILATVPFASPHTPIGPFIIANWVPFSGVAFLARRKIIFYVVLVTFALAGWIAVLNARAIF
jgi:hypothetical protein